MAGGGWLGSGRWGRGRGFGGRGLETFFEFVDASEQFGELLQGQELAFHLAIRLGGGTEPLLAFGDVMHDAGLGGDGGAAADAEVAG